MSEVLAWLLEHHPSLHATVEQDRDWLWLTADLKGGQNQAVRDSINHEGGFRFAKRGHALPSGKVAFWGHSCSHPVGFKRTGKLPGAKRPRRGDRFSGLIRWRPGRRSRRPSARTWKTWRRHSFDGAGDKV